MLFQFTLAGLSNGLVYGLIALSFVVIWKSTGVANLCLGQLLCFFSWILYGMTKQLALPYYLALPMTLVLAVGTGWLIERFALRPLIAQPILSLIVVTLGLAYFFEGLMGLIWPWAAASLLPLFPQEPLRIGAAVMAQEYLWAGVIALILFGVLAAFYKYHRYGVVMRATADDQFAVQACGVPVTSIFSSSWVLACLAGAASGILLALIGGIQYALITSGLKVLSVVILGGLDSFLGAIVGGIIIGLAENLGGGYLSGIFWPGIKDIIPFIIILVVLFIKPYGLFGEVRIERI
jgi:branched-chain amino acid transport system permease protein